MARKKRSRRPTQKLQRPAAWWREPIPAKRLAGISSDEAAIFIAQERLLRVEKLKQQIRDLREYSTEFTTAKGYPLTERSLVRISHAKIRKLERAHTNLTRAKSRSYIEVTPRSNRQRTDLLHHVGAPLFPGQKKFFYHTERAKTTRITFDKGNVVITDKVKGGETYYRVYYFPRKPRSWEDIEKMTAAIQRRGMAHGNYKIRSSLYGDIGGLWDREQLQYGLREYFGTYTKYMAGTIIGWRWYGSSYSAAKKTEKKKLTTEERFRVVREHLRYKEKRRVEERLGIAKRCRKCKRRRCRCPAPVFK